MSEIDVDKLRSLAAALNRGEAKHPNPFYVGFGDAILEAIGDVPANDIGATGRCPNCAPGYDCSRGIYTPPDTEETPA